MTGVLIRRGDLNTNTKERSCKDTGKHRHLQKGKRF